MVFSGKHLAKMEQYAFKCIYINFAYKLYKVHINLLEHLFNKSSNEGSI